jgi:hypothetical protein
VQRVLSLATSANNKRMVPRPARSGGTWKDGIVVGTVSTSGRTDGEGYKNFSENSTDFFIIRQAIYSFS